MPRNVSQSPHELPTYTLRFIFTLRASAQRAGRILTDRIESKRKTIYVGRFRAACSLRGPFFVYFRRSRRAGGARLSELFTHARADAARSYRCFSRRKGRKTSRLWDRPLSLNARITTVVKGCWSVLPAGAPKTTLRVTWKGSEHGTCYK
jgi:hypothetical protein